jgi:hypothetical protein
MCYLEWASLADNCALESSRSLPPLQVLKRREKRRRTVERVGVQVIGIAGLQNTVEVGVQEWEN